MYFFINLKSRGCKFSLSISIALNSKKLIAVKARKSEKSAQRSLSNCSTEWRWARRWRRRQQHDQLGQNQTVRRRFLRTWQRRPREPGTASGIGDLRNLLDLPHVRHRRGNHRRAIRRSSLQVNVVYLWKSPCFYHFIILAGLMIVIVTRCKLRVKQGREQALKDIRE